MPRSNPERAVPCAFRPSDIVQQVVSGDVCDLGPGYLDPALIPLTEISRAFDTALSRYGTDALAYGHNQGALPFRGAIASHISRRDGADCRPDQILVTAGTSHTLDVLAAVVAEPGDVVLVEALSYDLGRRIFEDRGLLVREVERDASGISPEGLERAVRQERAVGRNVAFAYVIPTFHNPTGTLMPGERRREVLDAARRNGLLVLEDDAYADVPLEREQKETLPSLSGAASFSGVWQLGTFSKSLAPGLRLGWLAADPGTIARLADRGVFVSGGCPSHLAALAVSVLLEDGTYERHLHRLRHQLRERRDALCGTLRDLLPRDFHVSTPAGGLFTWVRLPDTRGEEHFSSAARRAGVLVAEGARFGSPPPSCPGLRLSFSAYPPARLRHAAHAVAGAWGDLVQP